MTRKAASFVQGLEQEKVLQQTQAAVHLVRRIHTMILDILVANRVAVWRLW